jgi:hypothetical protein
MKIIKNSTNSPERDELLLESLPVAALNYNIMILDQDDAYIWVWLSLHEIRKVFLFVHIFH